MSDVSDVWWACGSDIFILVELPCLANSSDYILACINVVKRSYAVLFGLLRSQSSKGPFIATKFNSTQLNSTRQREQQLTQFVGRDVININTTDLAARCSTGSVEFSSVELSCVAIDGVILKDLDS